MTPIDVAAAVVVVGGAVIAVAAGPARIALLGLAAVLLFSPFVADPLPATLPLAIRLVGGTLAAYLLFVTARRASGPVGSPLGGPALLAGAGVGFAAGFEMRAVGLPHFGPDVALATGLACLVIAVPAVATARDAFRLGASLVVAASGVLVLRAGLAGSPSAAEEVAVALALVTLGGAIAALGGAAAAATGTLSLDDVAGHPDGARRPEPPRSRR